MFETIIILSILLVFFVWLYLRLRRKYKELLFSKRSQSSRYGKMTEQFMPFLKDYPYDPSGFRFIGTPIDGIQFNDDKIIFIEFKTASAQMTQKQREIRDIIKDGQVIFEKHTIK